MTRRVFIRPNGDVEFIYADSLAPLLDLGPATVTRASHVEPAPGGGWTADMTPRRGPILGPFPLHQDAITAERAWLDQAMEGAVR